MADGVIVGSAIVKIIEKYGENAAEPVYNYVKEMADAVKWATGTGTVAHKVSLLSRYVSPLKKSESSRKELSGFFVFIRMQ